MRTLIAPTLVALLSGVLAGCVSIDEVQTPNGDVSFAGRDDGATGSTDDSDAPPDACADGGWTFVSIGGREQAAEWSAPVLTPSCSNAPHRLTALAPRLGALLELGLSPSSGRIVEALYTSTELGADGEPWGDYSAPVELDVASFAPASAPARQPFELAGAILGPYGPVALAVSGCASVRSVAC